MSIPRDAPENPYAVENPPVRSQDGRRDAHTTRAPRGVYERGLAACRAILREHGASEHGPHYTPRREA